MSGPVVRYFSSGPPLSAFVADHAEYGGFRSRHDPAAREIANLTGQQVLLVAMASM